VVVFWIADYHIENADRVRTSICGAEHTAHLPQFVVGGIAMVFDLPLGKLISTRRRELGVTTAEIARRVGYRNIGKGVRRIDELCQGDFRAAPFIVGALPRALELPEDDVKRAIQATEDELDARDRARIEEEEQRYRERFKPHAVWATERLIPRPIFVAAIVGVENLLRFDLDIDQGEETFVGQAIAANPSWAGPFGKVVGFYLNLSPDKCLEYDREGNVLATFPRARRAGWADFTLKGDNRSLLPLFGIEAP
jgi:hypothetical protein